MQSINENEGLNNIPSGAPITFVSITFQCGQVHFQRHSVPEARNFFAARTSHLPHSRERGFQQKRRHL
jgi:hypothetical protein